MDNNVELVDRIIKGDKNSFNQLLENHRKMIFKIINYLNLERGDYIIDSEELFQEASIALYEAVFTFEKDKQVKFSSYAYLVIRSRIYNILRSYNNIYKEESFSIDNEHCQDRYMYYAVKEDPVSYHKEKEFRKHLNDFIRKLPKEDKKILQMRNCDISYKDISKHLKINTKRIDNRIRLLRKRLSKYLENK